MHEASGAEARLRRAATLPGILVASFDAFEVIRLLARDSEDTVPALFAAFMTAADAAVDGREAVTTAPSLPRGTGRKTGSNLPTASDGGLATVTDAIAALAVLLGQRLGDAAALPAATGDLAACEQAAAAAERISRLMARGHDDPRLR